MGRDSDNWVEQVAISGKRVFGDIQKWTGDVVNIVTPSAPEKAAPKPPPVAEPHHAAYIPKSKLTQQGLLSLFCYLAMTVLGFSSELRFFVGVLLLGSWLLTYAREESARRSAKRSQQAWDQPLEPFTTIETSSSTRESFVSSRRGVVALSCGAGTIIVLLVYANSGLYHLQIGSMIVTAMLTMPIFALLGLLRYHQMQREKLARARRVYKQTQTSKPVTPPSQKPQVTEKTISVSANQPNYPVYSIVVPRTIDWNSAAALQLINQILKAFPVAVLRIHATNERILWQFVNVMTEEDISVVEQLIRASCPQASIEVEIDNRTYVDKPHYRYVASYKQLSPLFVAPLLYVTDIKQVDPLASLTEALNGLRDGEQIIYSLAVANLAAEAYAEGQKMIMQSTIHPLEFFSPEGRGNVLAKVLTGRDRTEKYVPRDQRVFEDKLRERLYRSALCIQVDAPSMERVLELMLLLDTQLGQFTRDPYNALDLADTDSTIQPQVVASAPQDITSRALTQIVRWLEQPLSTGKVAPLILEPKELAALWHLPHKGCSAPRIAWATHVVQASETVVRNTSGISLGKGWYQGRGVEILLPTPDRVTHLNIVGKTGTGKSTLMHYLIHQDIAAGRGVAVIDPHGKLVRDILTTSIPREREGDVVVLDLANESFPPPLNPLVGINDYTSTLKMVSIIDRMFSGTEESARMSTYLRAVLITLQAEPNATMRDVTRLFNDAVYRQQCLDRVDDPETQDFWDYQYNNASPSLQRQIAEPIIVRVRPFYANPTLYPILCHPDSVNFRALIQQNKIVLISLAFDEERVPKQERDLVGALLMSRLQMAGMKERAERRDPYFIYVDEVQRFVTTSLDEVLSEARKFGLSLVTANQYLQQLSGKTLEAVMGNVGTTIVFRCSPDDATTLATYMRPEFQTHDLTDLDRYVAAVKMQIHGQTQPAFSLETQQPPLVDILEGIARERYLRDKSQSLYTAQTRAEVLEWLKRRYSRKSGVDSTSENTGSADISRQGGGAAGGSNDDPNRFYDNTKQ